MNVKESVLRRVVRWKIDINVAGHYLTPFFTFQTLAALVYTNSLWLQEVFSSYLSFFGLMVLAFPVVFKVTAKIIYRSGLYKMEQNYANLINPFTVDVATERDKNYSIPFSVANCDLGIEHTKMDILIGDKIFGDSGEWRQTRRRALERIDALAVARDRFESLRHKSV